MAKNRQKLIIFSENVLKCSCNTELRDQSVFITWGGPEEFRGGSLEIRLPKGGVYSLEDFVEGGEGFKKIHTVQLNLQYLFLTLANMILQKPDCIATKKQK